MLKYWLIFIEREPEMIATAVRAIAKAQNALCA
jgi:hypothetical protein